MSTPTQVQHPWKAAVRTGIQVFLAAITLGVIVLPMVSEFVAEFFPGTWVIGFLATAAAFLASLGLLVTRIMAIPMVNDWLTQIGLGAAPKSTNPKAGE